MALKFMSVSYTHLDVYKRQLDDLNAKVATLQTAVDEAKTAANEAKAKAQEALDKAGSSEGGVDVYKRQLEHTAYDFAICFGCR